MTIEGPSSDKEKRGIYSGVNQYGNFIADQFCYFVLLFIV